MTDLVEKRSHTYHMQCSSIQMLKTYLDEFGSLSGLSDPNWRRHDVVWWQASHRDFLGAILATGIVREKVRTSAPHNDSTLRFQARRCDGSEPRRP